MDGIRTGVAHLSAVSAQDEEGALFNKLPPELLSEILSHLPFSHVLNFSSSCRCLRKFVVNDKVFWKNFVKKHFPWAEHQISKAILKMPQNGGVFLPKLAISLNKRQYDTQHSTIFDKALNSSENFLAIRQDGSLVSGHSCGKIGFWPIDGQTPIFFGKQKSDINGFINDCMTDLALLPNGYPISCHMDGTVRLWSLNDQSPSILFKLNRSINRRLAIMPDGKVVVGSEKKLSIYSLDGREIRSLSLPEPFGRFVVFPNGNIAIALRTIVQVWLPDNSAHIDFVGHNDEINCLAVLPDGRLATGSQDKTVRVWALDGRQPVVFSGHEAAVLCLTVLPDERLVSGSKDDTIRIWSLNSQQTIILKQKGVQRLAAFPDGRLISISSDNITTWFPEEITNLMNRLSASAQKS